MKHTLESGGIVALSSSAVGLLAVGAISGNAGDMNTDGGSLEEFKNPDGSIDLEALRSSGYEGSLDLTGLDLRFDLVTSEPVVQPITAGRAEDHPDDIYWDNSISPSVAGATGSVNAGTIYDGNLIVGGYFWVIDDQLAYYIASWDGSNWSPLGSGTDGSFV